jgi:pyruvate/2-oxoglutarate dehydrogenase complex dihydrolipoamide dehydrogenase (E3) component
MWPRFAPVSWVLKLRSSKKITVSAAPARLRGCIPTKQMLMSAHVYEQMQHAADFGVQASGIQLAFADVQKRKDKVVLKNSKGIEYLMKKNKVTVFKGTGKLALARQS